MQSQWFYWFNWRANKWAFPSLRAMTKQLRPTAASADRWFDVKLLSQWPEHPIAYSCYSFPNNWLQTNIALRKIRGSVTLRSHFYNFPCSLSTHFCDQCSCSPNFDRRVTHYLTITARPALGLPTADSTRTNRRPNSKVNTSAPRWPWFPVEPGWSWLMVEDLPEALGKHRQIA